MSGIKSFTENPLRKWQTGTFSFLREWALNPLRTAAIAPSGPALANLITADVQAGHGPVIELGAGTGVFTRALLARGLNEQDLAVVELNARFADRLRQSFPAVSVYQADAARLAALPLFGAGNAATVVSGLGFLSMPPQTIRAVLEGVFSHLRSDGSFYQFTYGWRCPVPADLLDRLDLVATRTGTAFANLPPATVYRISRRE